MRAFAAAELSACHTARWEMRMAELEMLEFLALEREVAEMKRKGNYSDLLLRRHYVKASAPRSVDVFIPRVCERTRGVSVSFVLAQGSTTCTCFVFGCRFFVLNIL